MRRDCSHLFPLVSILLLLPALSYGQQPWSNILSSRRAIDWSHAGLPATFPDGETTPNPWTPPTRTTLCATLSPLGGGQNDAPQIEAAMRACTAGGYAKLGAGTFTISTELRLDPSSPDLNGHNNVTLRGSGPMSTTINITGGGISIGENANSPSSYAVVTSSPAVGTTQVTVSGSQPTPGLAWFTQCDTGYGAPNGAFSWASSGCAGAHVDNLGVFVCGADPVCNMNSGAAGANPHFQYEVVYITSVTPSGGNYIVNFTPGIRMPNWAASNTVTLAWPDNSYMAVGMGIEDLTLNFPAGSTSAVAFADSYACWIKGVRLIGKANSMGSVNVVRSAHDLIANNYFYANTPTQDFLSYVMAFSYGLDATGMPTSDNLIVNNLVEHGFTEGFGQDVGTVVAYNYYRDAFTTYPNNGEFIHHPGHAFNLREGNQMNASEDDDTWGSHNFDTWFRNYYSSWDPPYNAYTTGNNYRALAIGSFSRFENIIGNALGDTSAAPNAAYETSSGTFPWIFAINYGGGQNVISDTTGLTGNSLMRWGNYPICSGNSHCNTVSWDTAENPTTLTGSAAAFNNLASPSTTLPASFFMSGSTAPGWWRVCSNWNAFPTSCAATQTQPYPPIGPEVGGGGHVNGHAWDIPAAVAWHDLPIDTAYQQSYAITNSSWSGGTETLTVSGLPSNPIHTNGAFQITGAGACNSSAGGEFLMTGSSATQITYALASNPGSCAGGTFKWPDIRQFDERVYANGLGGGGVSGGVSAPTGLSVRVQ